MFIAVLYFTDKTWKQSKCPKMREHLGRLQYINVMEYFIAIKSDKYENYV